MNCQTKLEELIPEKLNIIEESENYSKISTATVFFREGNGNPLQYFCLENPMERGGW